MKILGVGSLETRTLKANVLHALEQLHISIAIEEVEEVEKLMQYDISGIPALILNGEVLLQKQVPSVDELKTLLRPYFPESSNGIS